MDIANSVLSKEQYSAGDWQAFFTDFFTANPTFTDGLRSYLSYAVFEWSGEAVQYNLQSGLVRPLLDLIDSFMNEYGESLDTVLADNAVQRETLMNAHRFINALVGGSWYTPPETRLPANIRSEVYQFYLNLVGKYIIFKLNYRIDPINQPFLGAIRAQICMNLRDAVPLTTAIKTEIGNALGLKARYSIIWHLSSVLVIDNLDLDDLQLSVIESIFRFVPDSIYDLVAITVNDAIGNTDEKYLWYMTKCAVNISDIPVGTEQKSYFPLDITSTESDVFAMTVANEINRAVEAYLSNTDPDFNSRKNQLIEQAGDYPNNYLGDMFTEDFVGPQDFFVSIANRWFCSTKDALELAVSRFDSGYEGPITQFLFFGGVYLIPGDSEGDRIPFFSIDTNGAVARTRIPVERDDKGRIVSLRYSSDNYLFTLDSSGMVVDIQIE